MEFLFSWFVMAYLLAGGEAFVDLWLRV